jgi:hypothetical protein
MELPAVELASMLHLEQVLQSFPRGYLSELSSLHISAPVLLSGSFFGSSGTAFSLTKILMCWQDNRRRLPSAALDGISNGLNVTVSPFLACM